MKICREECDNTGKKIVMIVRELTVIYGYEQERLDRTYHGGGVSIYLRNSIHCKRRTILPTSDLELI